MSKNLTEKINLIGKTFMQGAKNQLKHEWVWGAGLYLGLQQGMKYKGNLNNGVKAGIATMAAISAASGAYNVFLNWDEIKNS